MTRMEARALRRAISAQTRRAGSAAITGHVLGWDAFARAHTIMAYASVGTEVDTWALLEATLALHKRLLLPRCLGGGVMRAHEVTNLAQLTAGMLRIPEPPAEAPAVDKRLIDLILVPGLLFDRSGNRMGQGAGYYDRYLADYEGMTCALAFSVQVAKRLDTKPHDVPVKALATEQGIESF